MPEARNNAIIKGNRAWIVWRDDNLAEAELYGRASLEDGQGQLKVNAFRWIGLWPLIGVALRQEKLAEAMDFVRMLLGPTQQPPSEQVRVILKESLRAWDAGEQKEAGALLLQSVPFAEEMGYL